MSGVFYHFLFFFQGKFWDFLHNRVATLVTIGKQKISPKSDFFKRIFTDSNYSRPNFFRLRLRRPGSGSSVFSSKYVGIARSLATRRTLGILKLLKCINTAQPEPCYKKTQLRSRSRSHVYENRERRSHFIFTRAQQPCLKQIYCSYSRTHKAQNGRL